MQTTLFTPPINQSHAPPTPNYLRFEPYIYFGLGLHGLILLGFLGGTLWAWTAVAATLILGISFFIYQPFTPLRPAALVFLTWLLVLSTGGGSSFLQLWFFIIAPLYSFILQRPYGQILPAVLALSYATFIFISPGQVPVVVLVARTILHFALGWLAYRIGSAYRLTIETQRETALALQLSTHRFELSAQVANLFFWYWDVTNDRVMRSEMGEPLLGNDASPNQDTLDSFIARVHPEDRDDVKASILQAVSQQQTYRKEFRIIDNNGRIRWIRGQGQTQTDPISGSTMLVGISQDISEEITATAQLAEQARLLNIVSDAIIATDSAFHIRSWNKAAESIYGWEEAEVIGKPMGDVVPTTYVDQKREDVIGQFMQSGAWHGEVVQTKKDGQQIYMLSSVSTIKDSKGQPIGAVAINRDITDRKKAEQALQESEDLYRTLVETLPLAVTVTDDKLQTIFANSKAATIFGANSPKELLGAPNWEMLAPTTPADIETRIEAVRQMQETRPMTYRLRRLDGKEIALEAHSIPVTFRGSPATLAVAADITEREQFEEAQKTYLYQLARAHEIANIATWRWDLTTNDVTWSDELYRMFGLEPGSIEPSLESNAQLVHPEDRSKLLATREKMRQQAQVTPVEFRLIRPDGQERIIWADGELALDEDGRPQTMLGLLQDVTERREMETALQTAASRNDRILQTMQDGYILADTEGVIVEVNPAYCQIIGYSRQELLKMNIRRIEAQLSSDEVAERIEQMVSHGQARFETRHQAKDGRLIDLDVSVFTMEANEGPLVAAFVRDITSRKQTEAELRQRNRELTSLLDISRRLSQMLDFDTLLDAVTTAIVDTIPLAETASAWLYNEAQNKMIPYVWKNHSDEEMSSIALDPETSLVGQVYRTQKPINIPDTSQSPHFSALNKVQLDTVRSVIGVPVLFKEKVVMILFADCGSQTHAFSEADLRWLQSLTGQTAVMMQNARLFAEEKEARKTAEILQTANLALTQTLDLDTILYALLTNLSQLVPYDTANVMLRTTDSEVTVLAQQGYKTGGQSKQLQELTFNIYENWSMNQVIIQQRSTIIPNTRQEARWEIREGAEHVMSWMGIPLIAGGVVIGLYAIDKSEPDFFTDDHLHMAEALSAQAAVAISNAQLLDALHTSQDELHALTNYLQSAREDERKRISHEIHDEFGQLLTAIKMNLAWLQKQCREEDQHILEKIRTISALGDEAIDVARRVARELRPGLLDDLGLAATLDWHIQEFNKHTHINTSLTLAPTLDIDKTDLAVAIYRIVQETLTNVARHAEATEVQVVLKLQANNLILSIKDNGRGITDAQKVGKQSLGLLGIRERVRTWQGKVKITGQKGSGTTILVTIPQQSFRD